MQLQPGKWSIARLFAGLIAGLLMALSACDRGARPNNQGTVRGEVTYTQSIVLAGDAMLTVQLEDVSRMDTASVVLAEQRIQLNGQRSPIPFELTYDRGKLEDGHRYALAARIEDSQALRFITTELVGISLAEPEVVVQIRLDPVAAMVGIEDGGPAFQCGGDKPSWSFSLAGNTLDMKHPDDESGETKYSGGYTALFGPDGGAFHEWIGQSPDHGRLKMRILPGHCENHMVDGGENGLFDYSVTVESDGQTLQGCCRMLSGAVPDPGEAYVCDDDTKIRVFYETAGHGGQVRLVMADEREHILPQQVSASGARYSDGNTLFWDKGPEALLELEGADAVTCSVESG